MKRDDLLRQFALDQAVRVINGNFEIASVTTDRAAEYLSFLRGAKTPARRKKAKR